MMAPPVTMPAKPDGRKRMPVGGIHQHAADDQKSEDGADLDDDHDVVGLGRLAHAAHQQHGQDEYDQKCREH